MPELTYLLWSVVLLIAHILIQASLSDLDKGLGWALGPQDEPRVAKSAVALRVERALSNYLQTYPAFVALALLLAVTSGSTALTATGAAVWFWARVAYVPAYASGLPLIRSLCWFASIGGLLMMLWPLLTS